MHTVCVLSGSNRQGATPGLSHPRGADLLQSSRHPRGEEDSLAGWRGGALHAAQVPCDLIGVLRSTEENRSAGTSVGNRSRTPLLIARQRPRMSASGTLIRGWYPSSKTVASS